MDSEELASESILGPNSEDVEDQEMADESEVTDDQPVTVDSLQPEPEKLGEAEPGVVKLSQIPLARIKHIMKLDTDLHMASQVYTWFNCLYPRNISRSWPNPSSQCSFI